MTSVEFGIRRTAIGVLAGVLAALGLVAGGYGVYLLAVGHVWTVVTEGGVPDTALVTSATGALPVVGGLLLAAGAVMRRLGLAWVGVLILALFAMLFLFGVGGVLIPVAIAALVLLVALDLVSRQGPKPEGTRT